MQGSQETYSAARGAGDGEAGKGVWTNTVTHRHTVSIASLIHADEQKYGFRVSAREPLASWVEDRPSRESGTVVIRMAHP